MATGTRGTNTMQEGLAKMVSEISQLKITPDADLEFLITLETQILQYIKTKANGALQGGMPGMGGGGMMGAPLPSFAGQGAGGVMQSPGMPNPDELRRMTTQ